jgi:hypothetical protein
MMRLLHWVLANSEYRASRTFPTWVWGAPPVVPHHAGNARWSVLYSDVGNTFYATCGMDEKLAGGWEVYGAEDTSWEVEMTNAYGEQGVKWESLDLAALTHIWTLDTSLIAADVAAYARQSGRTSFAFLPDQGVAAMQVHRTLNPATGELPAETWGIQMRSEGSSSSDAGMTPAALTYASWTLELHGPGPKTLVVTRWRIPSAHLLGGLLGQLIAAARNAGATRIEIWNVPESLREESARLGGVTAIRAEHLPSFRWYGQESVDWVFNERYVM